MVVSSPDQSIETLESSISKRLAVFSSQDMARSVYRGAASQCEVVASVIQDICPCSPLQQWQIQESVRQHSGSRTDQHIFRVPKNVSMTKLQDAWDIVSAASPALRTRIVSLRHGGTCQVTVRATPGWHEESSLLDYLQWDRDSRIRYGGPLCRFGEVDQPDGDRYFVLSLHPATCDPWTLSLILSAVVKAYEKPDEPRPSFHPFSAYIRRLEGCTNTQSARDFWTAQPRWSDEASLQFPRVPHGASEADLSSSRSLDTQLPFADSGKSGTPTMRAILHATWALCLSRLTGDGKACFGIYVDGRNVPIDGIARMAGPVGAVVPYAIDLVTLATGDSLLEAVREYANPVTPFLHTPDSTETAGGHGVRTTSRSFRNVLFIQNCPPSILQAAPPEILEPLETRLSEGSFHGARLIIRCSVTTNESVSIEMQFDKQMISPEDIGILLKQYQHGITQLLLKPSAALVELEPVSHYGRSLLLDWNTNSPSRIDACIQDQIRDVARRQPTAPAICSWECELDHGLLDDLSDRMAALLHTRGIKVGTMVPFFWEESAAAIIQMLGILKAGAAFVALDLDYPAQRLRAILSNTGASTIIVSSSLSERANAMVSGIKTVLVDMELIRRLPYGGPQQVAVQPSDTCYVTCTSGSTGSPKGMVVSHANLASSCVVTPASGKHHLNVGRPTARRYWVVNPANHDLLVPIGSPGELLIQGPIVAQGYLGDAEKTKAVFIEPPVWTSDFGSLDLSSHRWYKTGDIVVQTADGSVVFDGRKGTMVKLAGQRVELEEVEYHAGRLSDSDWTLAVELIKPSREGQDPYLAMFFAIAGKDEQLSAYSGLAGGAEDVEPSLQGTNGERKAKQVKDPQVELRKLWARELALPLDNVKVTDDFFSLGGSSIRAMRLVNTARRAGFTLTVTVVFSTPVLSEMAAKMRLVSSGNASNPKAAPSLTSRTQFSSSNISTRISSTLMSCLGELGFATNNIESVAKATDVQADMLAISELDGVGFHTAIAFDSTAGFDIARITRACEELIRHHSLLRTAFVQHGASQEQVVLKIPPSDMVLVTTTEEEDDEDKHIGINPVLGDRVPQFRVLVKGGRCHQLRFKIRHDYYDAIYLSMILEDFAHCVYAAISPTETTLPSLDFSRRLARHSGVQRLLETGPSRVINDPSRAAYRAPNVGLLLP
ncbi:MAG: hypothetical protein Q9182_004673 [Xanthomendoza sp. 2 TL-2023]